MDGGVGLHVMSQVGVETMLRDVTKDKNDGSASGLEDIMESGPHIVPRPLMDNVVGGQDDDGSLAVPGRLTDGVRNEGGLWQVGVMQTHFVTGITVF